ncbi:MAG: toll/interleukin-1 receptor domain-containing protein [Anaerolineales bacterium]
MKVFLSYAHKDRSRVEILAVQIDDVLHDAEVWYDRELSGGQQWWDEILNRIEDCEVFVFALTPDSTASEFCRVEYGYARDLNKPVLPILLRSAELPDRRLSSTQYVDMRRAKSSDALMGLARGLTYIQSEIYAGHHEPPSIFPIRPVMPDDFVALRPVVRRPSAYQPHEHTSVFLELRRLYRDSPKARDRNEALSLLRDLRASDEITLKLARQIDEVLSTEHPSPPCWALGLGALLILAMIGGFALFSERGNETESAEDERALATDTQEVVETPQRASPTETLAEIEATTDELAPIATAMQTPHNPPPSPLSDSLVLGPENATQVEPLRTLAAHTSWVYSVVYAPDSQTLISGGDDNRIIIWDVETAEWRRVLTEHTNDVIEIAYAPDGRTLASASGDETVIIWDAATGEPLRTLEAHTNSVLDVVYAPNGETLVSASAHNTIITWDVATGEPLNILQDAYNVRDVAYAPDGSALAWSSFYGTIFIIDTETGERLHTLAGHTSSVQDVIYAPDGRTLASASSDNRVIIWDTATGERLRSLQGHISQVLGVAYAPDGRTLASASSDNRVIIWDAATGEPLHILEGHTGPVQDVAYAPDGRSLASASYDNTVIIWGIPQIPQ